MPWEFNTVPPKQEKSYASGDLTQNKLQEMAN